MPAQERHVNGGKLVNYCGKAFISNWQAAILLPETNFRKIPGTAYTSYRVI